MGLGSWLLGSGRFAGIPSASGPHAIGTTHFELSDPAYLEPLGEGGAPRRIPVQAWYPARPGAAGEREPYLDDVLRAALSRTTGLPRFLLPRNPSQSAVDVPALEGRFPVLVFNHGFGSFPKQSATLLEELASQGYVALSVGHPFESVAVAYRDGTVVTLRQDLPAWQVTKAGVRNLRASLEAVKPLLERAQRARSSAELREAMEALAASPGYAVLLPVLERWTRDTRVVLDGLGRLHQGQPPTPLAGRLEPERLGVLGHSLGGILAGQLAMTEPRVRAGLSLDGAQLPPPGAPYRLRAPFCFVAADAVRVGDLVSSTEHLHDRLVAEAPPGSFALCLAGAGHLNFTDLNNLRAMARALGPIDRGELARALRALTVGFFDHHLRGQPPRGLAPSAVLRVAATSPPATA